MAGDPLQDDGQQPHETVHYIHLHVNTNMSSPGGTQRDLPGAGGRAGALLSPPGCADVPANRPPEAAPSVRPSPAAAESGAQQPRTARTHARTTHTHPQHNDPTLSRSPAHTAPGKPPARGRGGGQGSEPEGGVLRERARARAPRRRRRAGLGGRRARAGGRGRVRSAASPARQPRSRKWLLTRAPSRGFLAGFVFTK